MYIKDSLLIDWQEKPFRHAVIDNAWDTEFLKKARSEFPPYLDPRWVTYNDPEEFGKKAGPAHMWGPSTHEFFNLVRSADFIREMESSSNIAPLQADDLGGGMHLTGEGGRLEMHIDFNVHPSDPSLERRINMLVFLNDEWDSEWGGTLYLGENREVGVKPLFNRTVLFECSESSFHGHPDVIIGEHYRHSLACYYYAPVRAETATPHSTVWNRD